MISLRHKLWLGFGALLLILLAVTLLTLVVLTRHSHALERVFHENYDSARYCDAMKQSLDQLNTRAQDLIWQDAPTNLENADAVRARFAANLELQRQNCTLPGEKEHTEQLSMLWDHYILDLSKFDIAPPDSRADLYRTTLLPRYEQMQQTAQWISDANMSNMVSVDGQVKRELLDVRNALLVLVIAGTLAAALVVGAAGTSIIHPLSNLTNSARQIEAGDLDQQLPVRSHDEIGLLAEAFNSMAARLREFRRIDHDRVLRSQQTTQLAIDSLPDAVFIVGPREAIEISNRTAEHLFGISPGVTIGQLSEKLKWLAPLYDSVKSGQIPEPPRGYQSAIQVFDAGEERFLLPRAVPIFSETHTVIGVTIILVDVTRLRMADEAKSGLVSTVSHELRTPLTSIRMALNLLTGNKFGEVSPKQSTLLTAAREDADRLYRIIENLLNISRIESGRSQFLLQPMSPRDIVAQAVDPLRSAFAEKQIALQVDIPEVLSMVRADSKAINSALTNLLSNALKYTPNRGRVTAAVAQSGDNITFSVHDTGPGIPPEFRPRIFEKFFRVATRDGPSGAGLGLSIAQNIIEAHHGQIDFTCPPEGGTIFRFTIAALPAGVPATASV